MPTILLFETLTLTDCWELNCALRNWLGGSWLSPRRLKKVKGKAGKSNTSRTYPKISICCHNFAADFTDHSKGQMSVLRHTKKAKTGNINQIGHYLYPLCQNKSPCGTMQFILSKGRIELMILWHHYAIDSFEFYLGHVYVYVPRFLAFLKVDFPYVWDTLLDWPAELSF